MSKKSDKGFTLIEIIAVIIIIGIVTLIAIPAVSQYINESKKTAYISYEHSMVDAAKNQTIKCINGEEKKCDIPEVNGKDLIYLNDLIDKGYLELMSDPNNEGFCDSELSYVEIKNTGRDYEYTACLYCGEYQTEKSLCATYTMSSDGDKPVCGKVTGAGSSTNWTNNNRTISVKCSDPTSGCKRDTFNKTFTTTTKTSKIVIVDVSGETNECPVDVYVDKTNPSCDIEVTGNVELNTVTGAYVMPVEVSLKKFNNEYGFDADSGLRTYGIGTSISNKNYDKSTSVTAKEGITNIIGYVKDNAGNESICSKTVRVGRSKPEFSFRYGYQIFPEGEPKTVSGITESGPNLTTTSTTPKLTISNLNKYTNVDKVMITLSNPIATTTTATLKYTGNTSGTVTAPMTANSNRVVFTIPTGTYSSLEFTLGTLSGKTYNIEKIEVLSTNGGVYTNKNVSLNVFPKETGVKTTTFSYDSGASFISYDSYSYAANKSGTIYTSDKYNTVSDPIAFNITGIDKYVPTVTINAVKTGTSTAVSSGQWSDKQLDFTLTAGNIGISNVYLYYCVDINNTCNPNISINSGVKNTQLATKTGTYFIRYKAVTGAGTESINSSYGAKVDITTPTCTIASSNGSWTNQNITLTVSGQSSGGSPITSYSWDGTTFNGTTTHTASANGTFTAKVKNGPGTIGTCSITVSNIDKTAPTCSLKAEGTKMSGSNTYITNVAISFASATDTGGSNVSSYGLESVTGNKTTTHTGNTTTTYTGHIKDGAGNTNSCTISVTKNDQMTLTYNNNGGSGCSTKTITYNTNYGDLCTPSRTGYYFAGWFTDASAGTEVKSTTKYTTQGNSTVYAHWTYCPAGYYCNGGSNRVVCPAGTYSQAGATSCSSCSAGTYQPNQGQSSCITCPAGSYCSGGSNIATCKAGTYSQAGSSSCSNCSDGTYQPNQGQSSCLTCPAGSYCSSAAASATACPSGSTSNSGSKNKTACHFAATPSKWTKTTQSCGIANYTYYFDDTVTTGATGITSCGSASFTCNSANLNNSYDTCVTNYDYAFGSTTSTAASSCTNNNISCNASNYNKTNVICTENYDYAFGSESSTTASSCSSNSITCDASHYGQTNRSCTTNYSYSFGSASNSTVSSCSANIITCDSSHNGQTYRSCLTNYQWGNAVANYETTTTCSATTAVTCNASNEGKTYVTCADATTYSFGSETSSSVTSCSASSITCNSSNSGKQNVRCVDASTYAFGSETSSSVTSCSGSSITCNSSNSGKQNVRCVDASTYSFGSSTSSVSSCTATSSFTCNASNSGKSYVATCVYNASTRKYTKTTKTCNKTTKYTKYVKTCNKTTKYTKYVKTCNKNTKYTKYTYKCGKQGIANYTATTKTCNRSVSNYTVKTKTCNRTLKNYTKASKTCGRTVKSYDITHRKCKRKVSSYAFTSSSADVTSCSTETAFTCNASNSGKAYVSSCAVIGYTCPSGTTLKDTNVCYYN